MKDATTSQTLPKHWIEGKATTAPAPVKDSFTGEPISGPPMAPPVEKDDFLAEAIALAVERYLKPTIDVNKVQSLIDETLQRFDVVEKMAEVENYLNGRAAVIERELMEKLLNLAPIKVQAPDGTVRDVGLQHKQFEPIMKLISQRQNVWMVGPSGSGKTHLAESVAKSLGLSLEAISVGLQTSKSDLFGYTDAHGNFVETGFFRCYKNG